MTMHEDALRRASSQGGWDRRTLLKTFGAGAVAFAGAPLLSACTGGSGPAASGNKTVTFGSGSSDEVPKAAYKAVTDAFQKKSGIAVTTNVVAHNDFQNKINTYLQGSPDDSFTWFAGYRMQYYAGKGLLAPIDDVWEKVGGNYSDALKKASTGADGKMYLIPNYNYPWGFFYRKSLWAEKGYEVPTTYDALLALCKKMQADGLIPIEFADKDGWPAMGTFDYLNMRLNGYQFHMDLTAHKESWDQKKVGQNQSAKDFLAYLGTPEGQDVYASVDSSNIATAKGSDTSKFTPLTKKMADVITNAKSISQFFDRDALPAMANNVMIPALQSF